ncbi:hypothetical protein MGN70_009404 [Eutypa lata]|nr:hypothetical protein MGN70_009404 [Eutypa lata]
MKFFTIAFVLPTLAALVEYPSRVCISSPPVALDAGVSVVSAVITGDLSRRCMATMEFADPDFFPISYSFDTVPCSGQQVTSFVVPREAPNGEAYVTCHANISGGLGNPLMDEQSQGTVGCISEALRTSTKTATVTKSSRTFTEEQVTVFTTTTTSFPVTNSTPAGKTTTIEVDIGPTESTKSDWTHTQVTVQGSTDSQIMTPQTAPTNQNAAANATASTIKTRSSPIPTQAPEQASLFQDSSGSKSSSTLLPIAVTIVSTVTVMQTMSTCIMGH